MTMTTCPSFIDIAAFAQTAKPGADPFGADAALLPLRGGPVELLASVLSGKGSAETQTGDTMLIVAEGEARITAGGQTHALAKGESLVLSGPQGFEWSADKARIVTMRYTGGAGEAAGVTAIDPTTERVPSGAPLAELLIGPTPQCHNHTQFLSADGEFMVGVWDSSPYHRRAMPYRHFELMYLLDGSVTFIDEEGREGTFRKGDLFLVEQNAQCSWESREDVTKIFAIYRPK
ncbi:cupin domain-containing protein [Novosphingobium sediminicola]|nr:cupin domain-containing protein [Novosphingobium sediminicola]